MNPGVYDLTDAEYDAVDALRSSIAWKLVAPGSTPRHAWYACPILNPGFLPELKHAFDVGSAAHKMLLGRGKEIKIITAENFKTKAARQARDAVRSMGATPILERDYDQVVAMGKAAKMQLQEAVEAGALDAYPFDPETGDAEKTLIWEDVGGVKCKCRIDWLPHNCETLIDYKSTEASADPALWQYRQMRQLGFPFRLAFYRRGLEKLGLAHSPRFTFAVQESYPPYCLSIVNVDDELIEQQDAKVRQAIKIYNECVLSNKWPGYNPEGYVVGLTERERMAAEQQPQQWGNAGHVSSEDIASNL